VSICSLHYPKNMFWICLTLKNNSTKWFGSTVPERFRLHHVVPFGDKKQEVSYLNVPNNNTLNPIQTNRIPYFRMVEATITSICHGRST
jgi:hypothetical protein